MKRRNSIFNFFRRKSYVFTAILLLAAIFGMTGIYMVQRNTDRKYQAQLAAKREEDALAAQLEQMAKEREEETQAVENILKPESADKAGSAETAEKEKNSEQEGKPEETQTSTAAETKPALHFSADTELNWPLKGNVVLNYSMDQTVYFPTLDQYKYNPAIVIQGKVNDKVRSVAAGKIANIETNEVTGTTVTVDLGDGYSAVYGQLKEVPFHAGNYVKAEEVIGYLSEPTKYYSVEGPNLYFQLLKDNKSVDPMEYLQ